MRQQEVETQQNKTIQIIKNTNFFKKEKTRRWFKWWSGKENCLKKWENEKVFSHIGLRNF